MMPNAIKRDPNRIVGQRAAFSVGPFAMVGVVRAYMDEPCYLVVDEQTGDNVVVLAAHFRGATPTCPTCGQAADSLRQHDVHRVGPADSGGAS